MPDSSPPPKRKRLYSHNVAPERLDWTSDESDDSEEGQRDRFKAPQQRGRITKEAKKTRERIRTKASSDVKTKRATARNAKAISSSSLVGKTAAPKRGRPKKERTFGSESDEEDFMEATVPDYVQERRARFNEKLDKLKQGGLKLPPNYDRIEFSDDERLEDVKEKPVFKHIKPCRKYEDIQLPLSLGLIPAPVAQWLRDYQVEGAEFLHKLFVYQKGGILGDDMGLGKTIQVIAFLTAVYGKTGDERDGKRMRKMRRFADQAGKETWYPRTLIICPGTLIRNWINEFGQWGWWHIESYHGSTREKETALEAASSGRCEVLITTYSTYRLNRNHINLVRWDCVIADECHIFKERKSETSQSMNEVNALCRIGLTGTAIQNKYEELWTLLNWTNPGVLGPVSTWKSSVCDPLKVGQSHNATEYELGRARKTAKKLVENLLPQFFLRRMKTLIKDQLPKKSDRVVFCPLTETQADAYSNFIDSEIVQYIQRSAEPCDCTSSKRRGWCCYQFVGSRGKWQHYVFPAIATLQKLSNHLALLIPQSTEPRDKQAKDLETLEIAVPDQSQELYRDRDNILNYANAEFCGKWKILKKLLRYWHAEGDKVLVFSHSVRLLRMLQLLFTHTSYNVSYLDGAMSLEDRARTVDDFNADPAQFVFLISTRAGGVGLNITSANKVVVVDPNWNPSYDLQAQDRAYRIGQTRDVEVSRLVSAGTIEEIVYARQIYKQQQANIGYNASNERRYFQGVQGEINQKGEIFGLQNIFSYQSNNVVLRDIVNKTNIAESRAGVKVAGLDITENEEVAPDDPSDSPSATSSVKSEDTEDAAMSQLAALITSQGSKNSDKSFPESFKKPRKHDPVQAILSAAGVQYTHENSEVIGSSKVETHLSRKAELRETQTMDERVFRPESQSSNNVSFGNRGIFGGKQYRYRPPQLVKERQFCEMARWANYESAAHFGLKVEGWTQGERREFLEKFYEWRREVVSEKSTDLEEDIKIEENEEQEGSMPGVSLAQPDDEKSKAWEMNTSDDDEDEDDEL